jgi:hypothetical protein
MSFSQFNMYSAKDPFEDRLPKKPGRISDQDRVDPENEPEYFLSLDRKMDYDKIFNVVKNTVRFVTRKERSGLGLALSDLPATLGAFWQVGGNYIVMNQALIDAMTRLTSSTREFNSFIYMILTHEYLHSLGFIDEMEARKMTAEVALKSFGKNHPAFTMSNGDLWTLYPQLRTIAGGTGQNMKIIGNFDSSSTSYIA